MPACHGSQDCCIDCLWSHWRSLSTQAPPETPGHSQASLSQSLVASLLLPPGILLVPGTHKVLFVPSKSLFPQSCGSSVIKSCCPSKSNFLGILSPFAGSPGRGICCGPWNFATVKELLWYNCSTICGSSTCLLYGGANGNLLQEDWCHTSHLPGLLQPLVPMAGHHSPVPPQEKLKLKGRFGSVSCGVPGSWCTQCFVWPLWASLAGVGFDSKHDFSPPTILLGLLLCP